LIYKNIILLSNNNMFGQIGHKICSNKFKFIIAPIIVGVATSGLIFENLVNYHY